MEGEGQRKFVEFFRLNKMVLIDLHMSLCLNITNEQWAWALSHMYYLRSVQFRRLKSDATDKCILFYGHLHLIGCELLHTTIEKKNILFRHVPTRSDIHFVLARVSAT